jgi:hypothetical protein
VGEVDADHALVEALLERLVDDPAGPGEVLLQAADSSWSPD